MKKLSFSTEILEQTEIHCDYFFDKVKEIKHLPLHMTYYCNINKCNSNLLIPFNIGSKIAESFIKPTEITSSVIMNRELW